MLLAVIVAAALPDVTAVGVISGPRPEARVAVLRSAGRTRIVGIGEGAFGGRIAAIEPGLVVIQFEAGPLELRVQDKAPPAPPPAPTPADDAAPTYAHTLARADVEKRLAAEIPRILAESALAPVIEDGRVAGLRLLRVAPDTLLTELGLRPGDILQSLNDTPTDSLPALLALWPRLQGATDVSAVVLREGRPVTLSVALR